MDGKGEVLQPYEPQDCPAMTFAEMMALEQTDKLTFKSKMGPMTGFKIKLKGEMRPTVYGGHIQAQAVWAAAQTVPEGFIVHSVTGYYTSRGLADRPLIYHVHVIKTGRGYCQRGVDVRQFGNDDICFSNICSFKLTSPDDIYSLQHQTDIQSIYGAVTNGKHPADLPHKNEFKSLADFFSGTHLARTRRFGGLNVAMTPMKAFNQDKHPLDRRTLFAYAGQGRLPSASTHANLHAAAHIYASDREALITMARHLDVTSNLKASGSVSQTTLFHGGADLLSLLPSVPVGQAATGREKWFYQEVLTDRVGDGRATHRSRIWDDNGRHVATTIQDCMLQLNFKSEDDVRKKFDTYSAKKSQDTSSRL